MINDDELEKLACEYDESEFGNPRLKKAYKAGFRAAEKMINDRWPTHEQMLKDCSEFGFDNLDGENCMEWLKQKMLSAK